MSIRGKSRTRNMGFSKMTHAEKMAAKKAERVKIAEMAYASPGRQQRLDVRNASIHAMNRRNGIGRPPLYKRYLVESEAVA